MRNPSQYIIAALVTVMVTGCLKEKRINPYNPDLTLTQKYTHMMGGARNWAVMVNEIDTAYPLNDIAFKIDVINDTTIKVFNDILNYVADDTANSLYYVKSTAYEFCSIRYFYKRDSIEFFKAHNSPTESVAYTYNTYSTGL